LTRLVGSEMCIRDSLNSYCDSYGRNVYVDTRKHDWIHLDSDTFRNYHLFRII
jgi:hypothetical protein